MKKFRRENLSIREMEYLIIISGKSRESAGPDAFQSGDFPDVEQLIASLAVILEARKRKLMTMLNAIKRERVKVLASVDTAELSAPHNIKKLKVLEELINNYCYLNEGLQRIRRA